MKAQTVLAASMAALCSVEACLLPEEIEARDHFRLHGHAPSPSSRAVLRRRQDPFAPIGIPIGTGDRFEGGAVAPRGLASTCINKTTVLTPEEVSSGAAALARAFPDSVSVHDAPELTYEGRVTKVLQVGGDSRGGFGGAHVFIQGGIHARERGGPDYILYFLADLLEARRNGTGVIFGRKAYTPEQVAAALSVTVVAVPLVNPDGVAHDQRTGTCWRKNRNPNGRPDRADELGTGVDLNRNYDVLWHFEDRFSPLLLDERPPASAHPTMDDYRGARPFSEPETRNSKAVFDRSPDLLAFVDVHSVIGMVMYAWGDDDVQTVDGDQNFLNDAYDGLRGVAGRNDSVAAAYGEYMEPEDHAAQAAAVERIARSMNEASDAVVFEHRPSVELYPTCGTSHDYALSRYYGDTDAGRPRIHSMTFEFGSLNNSTCPFYLSVDEYNEWMPQVSAGLMEVLLDAAVRVGDTADDC